MKDGIQYEVSLSKTGKNNHTDTKILKTWFWAELYTLLAPKSQITYESEGHKKIAVLDYFSHRHIKKYKHV